MLKGADMKRAVKLSLIGVLVSSVMLEATDIDINGVKTGSLNVMLKAMTIIEEDKNGFAPSNGSGYVVKLKYESQDILFKGLKSGVGLYVNGDAGFTDWDKNNAADGYDKGAYGMVVDAKGDTKGLLGELYISYKSEAFDIKLGRQLLQTPLTQLTVSLMPNFYEAYILFIDAFKDIRFTVGHIAKISFGSRAAVDAGLSGENTGTAGVGFANTEFVSFGGTTEQAKFYDIGTASGLGQDTGGRSLLGISYTGVENLKADIWLYRSYDIADDYYAELSYDIPICAVSSLKIQAQYLMQKDRGDSLAGERGFNMLGAKVSYDSKTWGVYAALNSSGDKDNAVEGQYFNAWGADPAYTSSIFSRNAYRDNVDAYKIGGHYMITGSLKLQMSYASYGKSDTTLGGILSTTANTALEDAYEVDTSFTYKPNKEWTLTLFNAVRLSEFDGRVVAKTPERRQNHYRAVAAYAF